MKILAVIPARKNSKGVPHKNKRPLGGKPLILHTLETALSTSLIDQICVSSDCQDTIDIVNTFTNGTLAPFVRPDHLAEDSSPTLPVIQHAVSYFEKIGKKYDATILLQPTVPFRSVTLIENAISRFKETQPDSLITVREIPHKYNPHWAFEEESKGFIRLVTSKKDPPTRRQSLPQAFFRDGSIYITSISTIKSDTLYGSKIGYLINSDRPDINIDTMEDWAQAERFLQG